MGQRDPHGVNPSETKKKKIPTKTRRKDTNRSPQEAAQPQRSSETTHKGQQKVPQKGQKQPTKGLKLAPPGDNLTGVIKEKRKERG